MADTCLRLKELVKNFGKRAAVRGISLEIQGGRILGLLGPNGAGKSTTINMAAGFLRPTSGDILWDERPIAGNIRGWRRVIGVVLEELSLFEYLTVREHFLLMGRLYGLSAAESAKRADELEDFLRLGGHAETIAREASVGTRKKLAFGLGVLHSPKFLFLDEALNGIDALVVKDVKDLLRKMARRGTAVVLSSHVLDAAETLIDACVIITDGSIAFDGTMEDIGKTGRSLEETYADVCDSERRIRREPSWIS
jgi:ABC-2 type transport system ATP-binding protein